jgi:predicted amidohydrolase
MSTFLIALLHLAPTFADVDGNQQLVESALRIAARAGAGWVVTPELVTTGYSFAERIGTSWIAAQPDAWVRHIAAIAAEHRIAIFLSVPERAGTEFFNSMLAVDRTGAIVGYHRKINTLRAGAEAWSTSGQSASIIELDGFGSVGMLICADACSPDIARALAHQGARALVSSAAWAPGMYGASGRVGGGQRGYRPSLVRRKSYWRGYRAGFLWQRERRGLRR